MAAGRLVRPGAKYGPCAGPCKHASCTTTRREADALCPICAKPIGYDVRYYRVESHPAGTVLEDAAGNPYSLTHGICEERHAYEQRGRDDA
jgi:hypothetical protein